MNIGKGGEKLRQESFFLSFFSLIIENKSEGGPKKRKTTPSKKTRPMPNEPTYLPTYVLTHPPLNYLEL